MLVKTSKLFLSTMQIAACFVRVGLDSNLLAGMFALYSLSEVKFSGVLSECTGLLSECIAVRVTYIAW